ncbi:hypothetical protein [Phreatobacter cathodiphilus]|uniref:Cupin 2 conserved barrel domain-containing protein n=1 Tax=Phreatobacter cathodiphilus TaxID=1868589 RepID=A0A2S0NAA4_9HYPH|nr:hypothetical protein [Phreatobacter cathodiphilus]AVO45100.1 hypothetical protein C6569_08525 [Phreatobacter cathodiphilus]
MTAPAMVLRLVEDIVAAGARLSFPDDGVRRVLYCVHGAVEAGGGRVEDDQAVLLTGPALAVAGAAGATVWRYELAPAGAPVFRLPAEAGVTRDKLSEALTWPVADRILIRADSVSFPPGGCAYLHTHQGPGIRCLIDGGIRIDALGHSASYGPGAAWFESGPDPVFAQAAADRPSRFVRVMVLPAALHGRSSIAYVNAEDREKPKSQTYKGYLDQIIDT